MLRPCCTTLSCGSDGLSSSSIRAVASVEPSSTKTISADVSASMADAISRASGAMFSASSLTGTTTERATCMLMFRSMPSYNKLVVREANPEFLRRLLGPWRRGARALYRPGPKSNRAVSRRRIPPGFLSKSPRPRRGIQKAFQMTDVGPSVFTRLARRPALSLLLLCLVLWLPGALSLPALDRDESRFAQASKQMIETGDFVDIRFSTGTRYNKPVGIYWLQTASTKLLGFGAKNHIWTYRVPSLIGGYLAVLLVFWCASAFVSAETALAAAALLGASVLLTAETQIATTDAVLLAATLGAQAVLFRLYLSARDPARPPVSYGIILAGWFAFGVGVLVKGPVILGTIGVTALAISLWDRDWRWLKTTRAWWGFLIVALVVLPWVIAIALASHGAFFKHSLGHDFCDTLAGGQEQTGAPPGYYLALATLTLWPATLFVLPGLRAAWLERTTPGSRHLPSGAAWTRAVFGYL